MAELKSQELQEFYELLQELKKKTGRPEITCESFLRVPQLKDLFSNELKKETGQLEITEIEGLIEQFEALYSYHKKRQKVIIMIANVSLGATLFALLAGTAALTLPSIIIIALAAVSLAFVGFRIKLGTDKALSELIVELKKMLQTKSG